MTRTRSCTLSVYHRVLRGFNHLLPYSIIQCIFSGIFSCDNMTRSATFFDIICCVPTHRLVRARVCMIFIRFPVPGTGLLADISSSVDCTVLLGRLCIKFLTLLTLWATCICIAVCIPFPMILLRLLGRNSNAFLFNYCSCFADLVGDEIVFFRRRFPRLIVLQ